MDTIVAFDKEWRAIPGHEGYFASRDGEILSFVKSENKPRILSQITSSDGHKYVFLYSGKKAKKVFVHRAVLMAWDRLPDPGEEARHLDDDPDKNSIDNLAWGTRVENVADKRRNGGLPVGERSGTHKLTEDQVIEIRQLYGTMSLRDMARKYGVSHTTIRRAALGIKWRYLEERND